MNIIRTSALELTTIPAIAYKQKIASGGAGIKIHRLDKEAVAVFTIDKRTGQCAPYGKIDKTLFPDNALNEAIELTLGLPYSARGKINLTFKMNNPEEVNIDVIEDEVKINMIDSLEYNAIVKEYTNDKGKIDYIRMNKEFIQFASKSKNVADMVSKKASLEEITAFVVKNRAKELSGKKEFLNEKEIAALMETLNEIDPRGAFKELALHIRRMLAK